MQSNGGLTDARRFQGKDSILSGPAGGIVGMVRTAAMAGFDEVIGFDMGGTSTDVSHFAGEFEREFETLVAGVRMRAPMMQIHTVAAGGGSILPFDGARFRVGPESAGAVPGPACYRRGGPLTVTDCNVLLGRIQPRVLPQGVRPRRRSAPRRRGGSGEVRAARPRRSARRPARRTSVGAHGGRIPRDRRRRTWPTRSRRSRSQRGYDVTRYVLACFGGAGGQHACAVADALGMTRVLIHPLAGVLSAYGMGLADLRAMREQRGGGGALGGLSRPGTRARATPRSPPRPAPRSAARASTRSASTITAQGCTSRYEGTDTALLVPFGAAAEYGRGLRGRLPAAIRLHRDRQGASSSRRSPWKRSEPPRRSRTGFGDAAVRTGSRTRRRRRRDACAAGARHEHAGLRARPILRRTTGSRGPRSSSIRIATTVVEPGLGGRGLGARRPGADPRRRPARATMHRHRRRSR